MKHKFKKHILLALCLSFVLLTCSSCNRTYSEFEGGLKNVLAKQYGIYPPDSAVLVSAVNKTFLERDPHLDVIFDVPPDDLPGTFNERMWSKGDINSARMGYSTSVDWIFPTYYHADLHIEKIDSGLFRVFFCGDDVISKCLED